MPVVVSRIQEVVCQFVTANSSQCTDVVSVLGRDDRVKDEESTDNNGGNRARTTGDSEKRVSR